MENLCIEISNVYAQPIRSAMHYDGSHAAEFFMQKIAASPAGLDECKGRMASTLAGWPTLFSDRHRQRVKFSLLSPACRTSCAQALSYRACSCLSRSDLAVISQ
jgi:hypothetical protein